MLLKDLFVKRGIPSKKPKVTDYIKDNPEKFEKTNPGKASEQSIKEVLEDEQQRRAKYREFEKLRREELNGRNPRSTQGSERTNSSTQGSEQPARRELLQDKPAPIPNRNSPGSTTTKRKLKLDD